MEDLPTFNNATIVWDGTVYDAVSIHKVLKRDAKAMYHKRKATARYRNSDKGKAKQKEANIRFRQKNKENIVPST